MKVSYPLSLKVSLWLLLNLLLLATAAVAFFVVQGGLRWDALLAGPGGEHAIAKANVVSNEVAATVPENRGATLARLATTYGVDFFLVRPDDLSLSTAQIEVPAAVRTRMEYRGPRRGPGPGGEPRRPATDAPDAAPRPPDAPLRSEAAPRPEAAQPAPGAPPRDTFDLFRDRSRFILRDEATGDFWIGIRVPFVGQDRARFRAPATILAHVDSLWALLRYLELQPWLFTGLAAIAFSVLFWLPLVRSITHSIGQLTHATERIAEGRFETRVDSGRRDEIGKLGESVNRMAERLDAHMNGQKRFLGDVAHELCSPLARLQMAAGILAEQTPAALKDTVADLREEVQQMSSLVNELLAFTKSGLKARDIACEPVEVEPLVRETAEREDVTPRVTFAISPELRAFGQRELLGRALGNLLRNAARYAATGPIAVSAAREAGSIVIRVEDEGPGVPAADIGRLGEPFFRPELARTRESGGVGLGLAIVRNSIAACGGEVRFANRTPTGFRAEIRLRSA